MASEAVLKYLTETNRPYSCADVTVNLRGAFTKTAIQKALDALSESGQIKCKLYGKQKVYVAIQIDNAGEDTDIEDFDNQMKILTQTLSEKTSALRKSEGELKDLTSAPTTAEAEALIHDKKETIDRLDRKLNSLKVSTNVVGAEERKAILDQHGKMMKEYRNRKRICTEMLETVLEGYPKCKKTLLEELCIETDEMVNFKLISNS